MVMAVAIAGVLASPSSAEAPSRPEEGEVYRLYRSTLGRPPDEPGFAYWVSVRIEGVTLRAVADGFLNSTEYARRFGAGSDAKFVDQVYRNVLGRPGDDAGASYWLKELSGGLPRTEMVLLFSESPEHQTRTNTKATVLPAYRPVTTTMTEAGLGSSWRPGCPVQPNDLRAVEVDHVDFAGQHQRGTLIVHTDVAADMATVFGRLYAARYPIESIRPVDRYASDDDASMAANNTSGFNCRAITGGTSWSHHSYGTAVDINPVQNPYVSIGKTLPPAGVAFVDRDGYHPAMIRPGDVANTAFAEVGWRWGGDFRTIRDYQHFER